ncbi:MAG: thioredoxin family protein [Acidobacteriota bacterium]
MFNTLLKPLSTPLLLAPFATLLATLLVTLLAPAAEAVGPQETSELGEWLTEVEDAIDAAKDEERIIVVDLYADWCGWCKVLEDKVFTSPDFRDFTRDMVLLRVDTEDGGEGTELQSRYRAFSLPTTLILDSNLVKIGEIKGYAPTDSFLAQMRGHLSTYEALIEAYEEARGSSNTTIMRRLADDLHRRGDGQRAVTLYDAILALPSTADESAAWLHYLAADAHRLSGDFEHAASRLQRALKLPQADSDSELSERLDMLRFYIAHDSGDCTAATASLERFLTSHPESGLRSQARRTLDALRRGEAMECT